MAKRPAFTLNKDLKVVERLFDFEWFPGFSIAQKQRSIRSLHKVIMEKTGKKSLEVSTKSEDPIGRNFSAFNLWLRVKGRKYIFESYYQASKVYEGKVQFPELADLSPKDAKRAAREKSEGRKIIGFKFDDFIWPNEPRNVAYTAMYLTAIRNSIPNNQLKLLTYYDFFTDIEFNPRKSSSTQARSIVFAKIMVERYGGILEFLPGDFISWYNYRIKK